MNEADLQRLLQQGAHRLRLRVAFHVALGVLGGSLVLLAAGLFVWRLYSTVTLEEAARLQTSQAQFLILPPVLALLACIFFYAWVRPGERQVAHALDRAARLPDHLLTWLELRGKAMSMEQAEFRAAQARDAARVVTGLVPAQLLPLHWPAWAPALWLALILLCSALLAPPQIETEAKAAARAKEQAARRGAPAMIAQDGQPAAVGNTAPRVQPLSPTELWKLQLRATDPDLSAEQKKHLLDELQQKTGAIPESELTQEIRELLSQLREAVPETKAAALKQPAGSAQNSSNSGAAETSQVQPAAANTASFSTRGLALAETDFVDVKEELIRYYRGGTQQ